MIKTGSKKINLLLLLSLPLLALILYLAVPAIDLKTEVYAEPAILIDTLLLIPGLYYLIIRKSNIPRLSLVPVFFLCTVLARYILPKENLELLQYVQNYFLPVLELFVIAYLGFRIKQIISAYQTAKKELSNPSFYDGLKTATNSVLPSGVSELFSMEIAIFYYAFVAWKKPVLKALEWSYHKKSDTISLLIGIIILVIIETFALHFLLGHRYPKLSVFIAVLSVYSGLQILGILKSLAYRPHFITDESIELRFGIGGEASIDLKEIQAVAIDKSEMPKIKGHRKLSLLNNLDSHNVRIDFKSPQIVKGLYGLSRHAQHLYFYVDEANDFVEKINIKLDGKT